MSVQTQSIRSNAITLGFWAALLTAIFTVLFVIATFVFLPPDWQGIESYARSFNSLQLASVVPPLLFALTILVLMVSLRYYAAEDKKIFTTLGIVFSIPYATIIWINAYLQLFVVRLNIQGGELESLAILAMPNIHSVFYALEAVGYGFLSAATFAVSPVFSGGRLARWIRILFIAIGILGFYGVVIVLFDKPVLILAGLGLWNLLFPIAMVLVCIFFRRASRQGC